MSSEERIGCSHGQPQRGGEVMHMKQVYEAPTLVLLGSVADLTQAAVGSDERLFSQLSGGGR